MKAEFNSPVIPDGSVVAENATCKPPLQVAITEVLARHAKSYNTDRSGVGYVACRCGLELRLDGATSADDARMHAAHQSRELLASLGAPLYEGGKP